MRIVPVERGHLPLRAMETPGPPGTAGASIALAPEKSKQTEKENQDHKNSSPVVSRVVLKVVGTMHPPLPKRKPELPGGKHKYEQRPELEGRNDSNNNLSPQLSTPKHPSPKKNIETQKIPK